MLPIQQGEYHLTLPSDTYSLYDARRAGQVRRRREALAYARRELGRAVADLLGQAVFQ